MISSYRSGGQGFFSRAAAPFPPQRFQQVAHGFVMVGLTAEREVGVNAVFDAAAFSFFSDVAVCLEVVNDIAGGFFGDAHGGGNFAGRDPRLLGDEAQNQRMVGEEFPSRHAVTSLPFLSPGKFLLSLNNYPGKLLTISSRDV